MATKTDASFGIIPVRWREDQWEVFLIHQLSEIGNNSYWVFPKGHPENNESPLETAQRELKEETNLIAKKILTEPTFTLEYSFVFDDMQVQKTVEFFIGLITNFHTKLDPKEVKEAGWYKLEDVASRLDYEDTKKLFSEVKEFLQTKKEEL